MLLPVVACNSRVQFVQCCMNGRSFIRCFAHVQAVELGEAKANLPIAKCFALSIMGGIFIAFGGALAVSVGPNCPGVAQSNPGLLKMITGDFS